MSQTRKAKTFGLLLQGLAVLGSVLLAFAIDAWWDRYSDRATETEILNSIRAELLVNRERIENRKAFVGGIQASAMVLLSEETQNPVEVSADSLDHLLGDVTFGSVSRWVTASVDALVSSGDLSLVPDPDLRAMISLWVRLVAQTEEYEIMRQGFLNQRLFPYLSRHADLARITNGYTETPGTGEPATYRQFRTVSSDAEHRAILEDREFRNLVVELYWGVADAQTQYERFGEALTVLLTAVEARLAN